MCWILFFTKMREVIAKLIVASTSKVTLILHLVKLCTRVLDLVIT
jgi:hypothetical protein